MNAVIVNCFDTYEDRVDLVHSYFNKLGYKTTIVQSDFRHIKKEFRFEEKEGFTLVKTKPYYKNLSVARLSSHYTFAKEAFKLVNELNPDLLYVMVPPNSLAMFAARYKKKHKRVKLIFDLIDLWPETMPMGSAKEYPPFTYWRMMRDNSLKYVDYVITECDLYQEILKRNLMNIKARTIYLAKQSIETKGRVSFDQDQINLCYLGSINNIIDIPKIKNIIYEANRIKPVTLHVIGDGESKEELIDTVSQTGATVRYYGKIYDPQLKQDIFNRCSFGLNIMKSSVCVGLTMKSIDYFQLGLPIINNIQADTKRIVEKHNVGINIIDIDDEEVSNEIVRLSLNELMTMRIRAKSVFEEYFSQYAFEQKMDLFIKEL